jgi:hypothetical protein
MRLIAHVLTASPYPLPRQQTTCSMQRCNFSITVQDFTTNVKSSPTLLVGVLIAKQHSPKVFPYTSGGGPHCQAALSQSLPLYFGWGASLPSSTLPKSSPILRAGGLIAKQRSPKVFPYTSGGGSSLPSSTLPKLSTILRVGDLMAKKHSPNVFHYTSGGGPPCQAILSQSLPLYFGFGINCEKLKNPENRHLSQ